MNRLSDESVQVERRELVNASMMAVEAGTTGPRGGDAGHGSRMVLRLDNLGATAWEVEVDGQLFDHPRSLVITVGGDSEGGNLLQALEYAALILRQHWSG